MTTSKMTRIVDDYLIELSLKKKSEMHKVKLKVIDTKTGSSFKTTIANKIRVAELGIGELMQNDFYRKIIPESVINAVNETFELLNNNGCQLDQQIEPCSILYKGFIYTVGIGLDTVYDTDDEYFAVVCDKSNNKIVATIYYTADLKISKIVGDIDGVLLETLKNYIVARIENELRV